MTDQNQGSGVLGGLLASAGFAAMALGVLGMLGLAVWRYGVAKVSIFFAPLFTVVAISPNYWFGSAEPHSVVHAWSMMPWTLMAVLTWAMSGMALLGMWLGAMPPSLAGRTWRDWKRAERDGTL